MANWSTYSGEELLSLKEATRSEGLRRFLKDVQDEGYGDLLDDRDTGEARGRIKLAKRILDLNKEIQAVRKMQSSELTTELK